MPCSSRVRCSARGSRPIVVGSDQTGSGTAYTARGRHFGRFTASGAAVRKDVPIAGLAGDSVDVPLLTDAPA